MHIILATTNKGTNQTSNAAEVAKNGTMYIGEKALCNAFTTTITEHIPLQNVTDIALQIVQLVQTHRNMQQQQMSERIHVL